ncbi:hypothetical protein [Pseudodesulfovibrio indicus]|uniref:hypothetical protein n=1 Tax=Pseudodesulfovibrio indicus TaxID=1716143 RepID=UPI000A491566|nr:hypothetical protein [Pseudodesulfovibrio indicus]
MSGSSGMRSGLFALVGGGDGDCYDYYESTILNSPDPDVLENISESEILDIEFDGNTVYAVDDDGAYAGSITTGSLAVLIGCIEMGVDFIAIVEDLDGGRCVVTVQPESDYE